MFVPMPGADPGPVALEEPQLFPLSANSLAELRGLIHDRLAVIDAGHELPPLQEFCRRAATEHPHRAVRTGFVAGSYPALADFLRQAGADDAEADPAPAAREIVLVFSGQGSQWTGMGKQLARRYPVFRAALRDCDRAIREHAGFSVLEQLDSPGGPRLHATEVLQPTVLAMQVALAALWRSWGVEPDAVVGHSMGEVAAAHVAGALTLDDAARIAVRRSALLQRLTGRGSLLVTELGPADAAAVADGSEGRISIAAQNSPQSTVLAGDTDALARLVGTLEQQDIYCKLVRDTVASHSAQVDELREDLHRALADLRPMPAALPMYSTVEAAPVQGTDLTAEYWVRNLRQPVRFAEAVHRLRADGHGIFLEISPHPVLLSSIRQCLAHHHLDGRALPSGRRGAEDEAMLTSAAELYALGFDLTWSAIHGNRPTPRPKAQLTAYRAALLEAVTMAR
ncbi:acyltransferase domain-containing protein [Saccharopolyspora sp. NPDC000359]|uniref:acyltransferase domain-containing protein n=1 Tax=Saccharopolyspora sp. NPDC000359 TaxID=3154251 RepID=UPI0033271415